MLHLKHSCKTTNCVVDDILLISNYKKHYASKFTNRNFIVLCIYLPKISLKLSIT